MKSMVKNRPGLHLNPIHRDLLLVLGIGLLVAIALVSVGFVIFH